MNRKAITISVVALLAVFALAILYLGDNNSPRVENKGEVDSLRLYSIVFSDYEGNSASPKDFSGQPLVVNSWAVWCPFCVKELDDFAELQEEFQDEIVVVAINRKEPLEKAKSFTDSIKVTDKIHFWLDPEDSFYKAIGGFGMPETLFIDADGEIVIHKRGPMDFVEMREKTLQLLSKSQ
jgi:cytochrome c biogenesis protein CcmG, thiol:disulfide interchange protein DsbE